MAGPFDPDRAYESRARTDPGWWDELRLRLEAKGVLDALRAAGSRDRELMVSLYNIYGGGWAYGERGSAEMVVKRARRAVADPGPSQSSTGRPASVDRRGRSRR